jgi:redox-sensitive bicupin YhaK (pirin superfamily)
VIDVRPTAVRLETVQPGITTRHCFSSGAHYDPANIGFGSLIALDEHELAPGAGFGRHGHRGVEILSWVLTGTLHHEDTAGRVELVRPGTLLHQSAGSGIEHTERNASATEPLRFVQLVLLGERTEPSHQLAEPPLSTSAGEVTVVVPTAATELAAAPFVHLYVTRGTVSVAGRELTAGGSARVRAAAVTVAGPGELLVWRSSATTHTPGFAPFRAPNPVDLGR